MEIANVPWRTTSAQRSTPAAHVADLGLGTGLASTIGRLDTRFALVGVLDADQGVVGLHGLGHFCATMSRSAGPRGRPAADDGVGVAGRVFELVHGPGDGGVEFREGVDVGVEGVGVHDVEGVCVDFIHAEARVEVGERGHGRADPASGEGVSRVLHGAVERVVDHELVFVGVAEEYVGDDVR